MDNNFTKFIKEYIAVLKTTQYLSGPIGAILSIIGCFWHVWLLISIPLVFAFLISTALIIFKHENDIHSRYR